MTSVLGDVLDLSTVVRFQTVYCSASTCGNDLARGMRLINLMTLFSQSLGIKIAINLSVAFHDPVSGTSKAEDGEVGAGPDRLNSVDVLLMHKSRLMSQT